MLTKTKKAKLCHMYKKATASPGYLAATVDEPNGFNSWLSILTIYTSEQDSDLC